MKKALLIVAAIILAIAGLVYYFNTEKEVVQISALVKCLAENNVVIFGSATCPVCLELINVFGGHEAIRPIYVECTDQQERCAREMQTNFVPEIQIDGVLHSGSWSPEALAAVTGCKMDL